MTASSPAIPFAPTACAKDQNEPINEDWNSIEMLNEITIFYLIRCEQI